MDEGNSRIHVIQIDTNASPICLINHPHFLLQQSYLPQYFGGNVLGHSIYLVFIGAV
jgi:hypothetical protein